MNKIWFKNISILLLGLFLIVDSNMVETTSSYLKVFDFVENYLEKIHHDVEPAETSSTERAFEKLEFIVDDLNDLITPLSFFIFKYYPQVNVSFWLNKSTSILSPPPNFV
jgi:hypothetical protein